MILRPYQEDAVVFLSNKRRAAVKSAAGSGKTIIAAAAFHRVLKSRERSKVVRLGWLANTKEQVQQAYMAMVEVFFGVRVAPAEAEGAWKVRSKTGDAALVELKVACAAAFNDWVDRDLLIVDEAHHAATAPQWRQQIETCRGSVWGFTATPPEDEVGSTAFAEMFVNVFEIDRAHVAENLAAARVIFLDKTDPNMRGAMTALIDMEVNRRKRFSSMDPGMIWSQVAWQICVEHGIVGNKLRNAAVIDLARRHARDNVLVLVNQVEHGQKLAERIPGSKMCFSKMGKRARTEALDSFRAGKTRCLLATSLADEGLDLPMANVLVLVSGGRSRAKTEQRTGRVLRSFAGKSEGIIYDFLDEQHPLMAKHASVRRDLYERLGYKIEYETH